MYVFELFPKELSFNILTPTKVEILATVPHIYKYIL